MQFFTYLALSLESRIRGDAFLRARIDKESCEFQVISGLSLLVQAALDAVRRWCYQPTELNGDPIEVDSTITVSFVLGG